MPANRPDNIYTSRAKQIHIIFLQLSFFVNIAPPLDVRAPGVTHTRWFSNLFQTKLCIFIISGSLALLDPSINMCSFTQHVFMLNKIYVVYTTRKRWICWKIFFKPFRNFLPPKSCLSEPNWESVLPLAMLTLQYSSLLSFTYMKGVK